MQHNNQVVMLNKQNPTRLLAVNPITDEKHRILNLNFLNDYAKFENLWSLEDDRYIFQISKTNTFDIKIMSRVELIVFDPKTKKTTTIQNKTKGCSEYKDGYQYTTLQSDAVQLNENEWLYVYSGRKKQRVEIYNTNNLKKSPLRINFKLEQRYKKARLVAINANTFAVVLTPQNMIEIYHRSNNKKFEKFNTVSFSV